MVHLACTNTALHSTSRSQHNIVIVWTAARTTRLLASHRALSAARVAPLASRLPAPKTRILCATQRKYNHNRPHTHHHHNSAFISTVHPELTRPYPPLTAAPPSVTYTLVIVWPAARSTRPLARHRVKRATRVAPPAFRLPALVTPTPCANPQLIVWPATRSTRPLARRRAASATLVVPRVALRPNVPPPPTLCATGAGGLLLPRSVRARWPPRPPSCSSSPCWPCCSWCKQKQAES